MKQLKKVIEETIGGAGIKAALDQESAILHWGDVVGEGIFKVAKAEKVESGVLIVKVGSSVWRQELHMQKEKIINKINKKIGTKTIKDILFI